MSSIPSLTHPSTSHMTDLQNLLQTHSQNPPTSHPTTTTKTALKYFNMRVTQRLHRYRSMKKHWQEVATFMQSTAPSSGQPLDAALTTHDSTKNSTVSKQKLVMESKACGMHDGLNTTTTERDIHERKSNESHILHARIQQDLLKLRRIIKHKRKKFGDNISFVSVIGIRPIADATSVLTAVDDQQINKDSSPSSFGSPSKCKPLDLVKVAGSRMRSSTLPKSDSTDSGIGTTSNSSSTCSQYPKASQQQQKSKEQSNKKTFNICQSRASLPPSHPSPLPSDSSPPQASPPSKKKANTSSKPTQNSRSKQTLPSRLSSLAPQIPAVVKKKQPSFTKQEVRAVHTRRLSVGGDVTTCLYTYAALSSSLAPHSKALKRNSSLLPVLLKSSSCLGLSTREVDSIDFEYRSEDDTHGEDGNYYHLLDYKHLINHLPKPVVSIRPRCGQDDYEILFDQLALVRKRMPASNTYDEFTRTA